MKAWNLKLEVSFFSFCDSSFEHVRVTSFLHFSSGFGHVRADSFFLFSSPDFGHVRTSCFTFFGSGFELIRANICTSEVHVLSMSEPLFFLCFLKHFLSFLYIYVTTIRNYYLLTCTYYMSRTTMIDCYRMWLGQRWLIATYVTFLLVCNEQHASYL